MAGGRNDSVWKGLAFEPGMLIQRAFSLLDGWTCANEDTAVHEVVVPVARWTKPRLGRLKLNTDASLSQEENLMGLGWVLRDEEGKFLAAKNMLVSGSYRIKEAEAMSLREALSWLKGTGIGNVDVEMDSQVVYNAIRSSLFSSGFGFLVDDVKELAFELGDVEFYCVKRFVNSAVHSVARAAFSMLGCGEWLDSPPSFLVSILEADIMN